MKTPKLVGACILVVVSTLSFAAEDGCEDVLKYSSRNFEKTQSDIGIALSVYDQYCENSSVKSGTSFNAGLGAVIEAVPINFNLGSGSTQERTKHFCKTFDSQYKNNQKYFRDVSTVVNESTSAWLSCKSLASRGVIFKPQIANTLFTIEVTRMTPEEVSVNGVTFDAQAASCKVPNDDSSASTVDATSNTRKRLDSGVWTLTCTRTPIEDRGTKKYPGFDLAIATTKGSLVLPIAAEASLPIQWATDIQRKMTALENLTSSHSSSLKKLTFASGTIPMTAVNTRPLLDGGQCPANSDATRGERGGRIIFPAPFEEPPHVGIALSSFDLTGSTNRLTVTVTGVDTQGFNYQYVTWCDTKIWSSQATWIAIPKT